MLSYSVIEYVGAVMEVTVGNPNCLTSAIAPVRIDPSPGSTYGARAAVSL
jgi:hypothetical protein